MELDKRFGVDISHWLEDIIKCELPGMTAPITLVDTAKQLLDVDERDARIDRVPQVSELTETEFSKQFHSFVQRLAKKCNWHVHNDTCYKYLGPGEQRDDSTC